MPYGAFGCGDSTRITSTRGHVLRADDPEAAQRHVRRAAVGVRGEVLGQRVAEAHVHGPLDLALAQQGVHRPSDVVRGDDLVDATALTIDDDELRGVAERGVDHRMLEAFGQRVRPVDAVLPLVVDAGLAARRLGRVAHALHRARPHQRAPASGGLARAELTGGVDDDAHAAGSTPSSSTATCRATVCTP